MYSQHKEDEFVAEYLVKRKIMVEPLIVDVGAGDGELMSNSKYIIENYPYKALLIEPGDLPFKSMSKLYKNHPRVELLQTAVAGYKFKYKLRQPMGSHWSIAKTTKSNLKDAKETQTLSGIFKKRGITKVGILSLDIEGLETEVLIEMLRNSKVKPEVIIIESINEQDAKDQEDLLALEYNKIATFGVNQVFILKTSDK